MVLQIYGLYLSFPHDEICTSHGILKWLYKTKQQKLQTFRFRGKKDVDMRLSFRFPEDEVLFMSSASLIT